MIWSSSPFIRFTLAVIAGILCATWFPNEQWAFEGFLVGLFFYFVQALLLRRSGLLVGMTGLFILFCTGFMVMQRQQPYAIPSHALHTYQDWEYFQIELQDAGQEHGKYRRYRADLTHAKICGKWQEVSGQMLWHQKLEDGVPAFRFGDRLLLEGRPYLPPEANNPFVFDYRNYLALKAIHFVGFSSSDEVLFVGNDQNGSVLSWIYQLQENVHQLYDRWVEDPKAKGVLKAMLMGQRQELSPELKMAFSSSGGMHILAVSGLHVGILYWLVMVALKRLGKSLPSRIVKLGLILAVLWGYALFTGLSPSVMRASLMFSLVALAQSLQRSGNFFNSLALAAFCLLLYKPAFLFTPGFQLSFLAVGGIVLMQPYIEAWLTFPNRWLQYFWQLSTVSLAAQLAVAPISLFYFHQFPSYFLLTNLVVVPLSFFIFSGGIMLLAFSWWPFVAKGIAFVLNILLFVLNWTVEGVEKLPFSTIDGLFLTSAEVFLLYGLLAGIIFFLILKKLSGLSLATSCAIVICFIQIQRASVQQNQLKGIFYAENGQAITALVAGKSALMVSEKPVSEQTRRYLLAPSEMGFGFSKILWTDSNAHRLSPMPAISWQKMKGYELAEIAGQRVLFLRSEIPKSTKPISACLSVDYVVISNNAVRDLEEIYQHFDFKKLIIDTSNKKYLAGKLENDAKNLYLSYANLHREGALIIDF